MVPPVRVRVPRAVVVAAITRFCVVRVAALTVRVAVPVPPMVRAGVLIVAPVVAMRSAAPVAARIIALPALRLAPLATDMRAMPVVVLVTREGSVPAARFRALLSRLSAPVPSVTLVAEMVLDWMAPSAPVMAMGPATLSVAAVRVVFAPRVAVGAVVVRPVRVRTAPAVRAKAEVVVSCFAMTVPVMVKALAPAGAPTVI